MTQRLIADVRHTHHLCDFTIAELLAHAENGYYATPMKVRLGIGMCLYWQPQTEPFFITVRPEQGES